MLFFIFSKKRTPFLNLAGVTLGHPSQGPTEKSLQDGYAADATPEKWGTVASVGDFRCSEWFFSQPVVPPWKNMQHAATETSGKYFFFEVRREGLPASPSCAWRS